MNQNVLEMLPRLTYEATGEDPYAHSQAEGSEENAIEMVAVCFDILKRAGLRMTCSVGHLLECETNERAVLFLFDLALFVTKATRSPMHECPSRVPTRAEVGQILWDRVKETLPESTTIPQGFGQGWEDGDALTKLLSTILPIQARKLGSKKATSNLVRVAARIEAAINIPSEILQPFAFMEREEEYTMQLYLAELFAGWDRARESAGAFCSPSLVGDLPPAELWAGSGSSHQADPLVAELASLRSRIRELEGAVEEAETKHSLMASQNQTLQLELYDAGAETGPLLGRIEQLEQLVDDGRREKETLRRRLGEESAKAAKIRRQTGAFMEKVKQKQAEEEDKLRLAMERSQALAKKFKALHTQLKIEQEGRSRSGSASALGVPPPEGELTLMFTDIQGSTALWESDAEVMGDSLVLHNEIVRKILVSYSGYEVKTEGDAFMVAFDSAMNALAASLAIQDALLKAHWSDALLNEMNPLTIPVFDASGELLWRGLRVRIGLHTGVPESRADPLTCRQDYFGPMVNRAARVEGLASGGQILMSGSTYAAVQEALEGLPAEKAPVITSLGSFHLKGIQEKMRVYSASSARLAGRTFESDKGNHRSPFLVRGHDLSVPTDRNMVRARLSAELQFVVQEHVELMTDLSQLQSDIKASDLETATLISQYDEVQASLPHCEAVTLAESCSALGGTLSLTKATAAEANRKASQIASDVTSLEEQIGVLKDMLRMGPTAGAALTADAFLAQRREAEGKASESLKRQMATLKAKLSAQKKSTRALRRYVDHILATGQVDETIRSDLVSALDALLPPDAFDRSTSDLSRPPGRMTRSQTFSGAIPPKPMPPSSSSDPPGAPTRARSRSRSRSRSISPAPPLFSSSTPALPLPPVPERPSIVGAALPPIPPMSTHHPPSRHSRASRKRRPAPPHPSGHGHVSGHASGHASGKENDVSKGNGNGNGFNGKGKRKGKGKGKGRRGSRKSRGMTVSQPNIGLSSVG